MYLGKVFSLFFFNFLFLKFLSQSAPKIIFWTNFQLFEKKIFTNTKIIINVTKKLPRYVCQMPVANFGYFWPKIFLPPAL